MSDIWDDDEMTAEKQNQSFLTHWGYFAKTFVTTWVGLRQDLKILSKAVGVLVAIAFRLFLLVTLPVSSAFFAFMYYLGERHHVERMEILHRIGYTILFLVTIVTFIWVFPYTYQYYMGSK